MRKLTLIENDGLWIAEASDGTRTVGASPDQVLKGFVPDRSDLPGETINLYIRLVMATIKPAGGQIHEGVSGT